MSQERSSLIDEEHLSLIQKLQPNRQSLNHHSFDFSLHTIGQKLIGPRETVKLPPSAFQLLWLLKMADGACVTYEEIIYFLYNESDKDLPETDIINAYRTQVRYRLSDVGSVYTVVSRHNVGLLLEEKG